MTEEEKQILALVRQRYAGDHNIETVFAILDRHMSLEAQLNLSDAYGFDLNEQQRDQMHDAIAHSILPKQREDAKP